LIDILLRIDSGTCTNCAFFVQLPRRDRPSDITSGLPAIYAKSSVLFYWQVDADVSLGSP
jgi:hypothetical protein